jgi:DNA-binding HxlR family transcriptional regulator
MRSYGQYCSVARALDVVGDRWTLLIIRELLLRGASRFTDLKHGLPGVATNLLSGRLKELEDLGLITRRAAPPPVATTLYDLTDDGLALEPVLKALGSWGLRYMSTEKSGDAFQAHWLGQAVAWFSTDADPSGPPAVIQLVASDQEAVVTFGDGQITTQVGRADQPDLVIEGPPRVVLGLLNGAFDLNKAHALGVSTHGRRTLLRRIQPHWAKTGQSERTSRAKQAVIDRC